GGLLDAGLERIDEATGTAREFDDQPALGWVNWTRCVALYANGRFADAIDVGRESMGQLRGAGDLWTFCDAAAWTALALIATGSTAEAHAIASETQELAVRLGHIGAQILVGRALILEQGLIGGDLAAYEPLIDVDTE